jgi:hypothetical protein
MSAGRTLVLASLPRFCVVCRGLGRVLLISGENPLTGATSPTTRCPHCVDQVPVVHLPIREDIQNRSA